MSWIWKISVGLVPLNKTVVLLAHQKAAVTEEETDGTVEVQRVLSEYLFEVVRPRQEFAEEAPTGFPVETWLQGCSD